MAFEQRQNSGSIFKNDRKEKDTHPDGKGSALIDGVEYWVSSWNKVGANGVQFRSLSFQRKEQAPVQQARPAQKQAPIQQYRQEPRGSQGSGFDDMDSDIPF